MCLVSAMPRWFGAHLTSGESQRVVEADEGLVTAAAALDSAALSASVVVQKLGACGEDDDAKLEELCEMALSASSELSSALECAYAVKPTSQTGKNGTFSLVAATARGFEAVW